MFSAFIVGRVVQVLVTNAVLLLFVSLIQILPWFLPKVAAAALALMTTMLIVYLLRVPAPIFSERLVAIRPDAMETVAGTAGLCIGSGVAGLLLTGELASPMARQAFVCAMLALNAALVVAAYFDLKDDLRVERLREVRDRRIYGIGNTPAFQAKC